MLRVTPASARLRTPIGSTYSHITPSAKRKLPYDVSPKSENKKRVITHEKSKGTVLHNKVRRSGKVNKYDTSEFSVLLYKKVQFLLTNSQTILN